MAMVLQWVAYPITFEVLVGAWSMSQKVLLPIDTLMKLSGYLEGQ